MQKVLYLIQAHNKGAQRREAPLNFFRPPWKNVLDVVNYCT